MSGPTIEREDDCAVCGQHVDRRYLHADFAINWYRTPGRLPRIGVMHPECVPPDGLEAWCEREAAS